MARGLDVNLPVVGGWSAEAAAIQADVANNLAVLVAGFDDVERAFGCRFAAALGGGVGVRVETHLRPVVLATAQTLLPRRSAPAHIDSELTFVAVRLSARVEALHRTPARQVLVNLRDCPQLVAGRHDNQPQYRSTRWFDSRTGARGGREAYYSQQPDCHLGHHKCHV